MWNLGVMNSFTMEATFNGSTLNKKAGQHFSCKDLEQLGYIFCDSLLDYCDPDQTKVNLTCLFFASNDLVLNYSLTVQDDTQRGRVTNEGAAAV